MEETGFIFEGVVFEEESSEMLRFDNSTIKSFLASFFVWYLKKNIFSKLIKKKSFFLKEHLIYTYKFEKEASNAFLCGDVFVAQRMKVNS